MKLAIALAVTALMTASAVSAQGYNNDIAPGYRNPVPKPHGFADAAPSRFHTPLAPHTLAPGYRAPANPPAFAPAAPTPAPQRFKPYGVYPANGGPPSAPKPPGYVDYYGTKKSEHPFAY